MFLPSLCFKVVGCTFPVEYVLSDVVLLCFRICFKGGDYVFPTNIFQDKWLYFPVGYVLSVNLFEER